MGMCKGCNKVFNTIDMVDGYCQNCATDEIREEAEKKEAQRKSENSIGFQWWQIWGWLGITIGNLYTFGTLSEAKELAVIFIIINTILMILVLRFNKYAFLIATILSINPLLWIINGIYLKNRWNHPKVNNGRIEEATEKVYAESNANDFCTNCGKELNTNGQFCPNCGTKI